VGHKHALQSIRQAKFFEGVTKIATATTKKSSIKKYRNMIGGLENVLFEKGLDQNMEYQADATALKTAYRTGYDPEGFVRVLAMLKEKEKRPKRKAPGFPHIRR